MKLDYRYESNGQKIGPGTRITEVINEADGSQTLAVQVDHVTNKYSPIIGVPRAVAPTDPVDPPVTPPPTPPAPPPVPPTQPPQSADVSGPAELAAALSSAGAGDVLTLAGGSYGDMPNIPNGVTLQAADPANRPDFSKITIANKSDISLLNIDHTVNTSPSDGDTLNRFLIQDSTNITIKGGKISGTPGVGKGRGLRMWGNNNSVLVEDVEVTNWWKGVGANGHNITLRGLNIHEIRSDGINTGVGSNYLIELCYLHDFGITGLGQTDHRDMIQAIGGAKGITIRDNFLDENNGLYTQGIWSDHKSTDEDLTIEDNILITSHSNAIAWISFTNGHVNRNKVVQRMINGAPRPDNNPGVAVPKINLNGPLTSFAGNQAPSIILPSDPSQVVALNDDAVRAAARADSRWAHFF